MLNVLERQGPWDDLSLRRHEVSQPTVSLNLHGLTLRSVVKEFDNINQPELDLGVSGASWHDE
ncbi:hypothetical protein C8J57DRAFT_1087602 [Mycena rebaudengoi]|nr:hypothetical protein C8J57DRAFT_1087602 [Mycena rebaudengoi]